MSKLISYIALCAILCMQSAFAVTQSVPENTPNPYDKTITNPETNEEMNVRYIYVPGGKGYSLWEIWKETRKDSKISFEDQMQVSWQIDQHLFLQKDKADPFRYMAGDTYWRIALNDWHSPTISDTEVVTANENILSYNNISNISSNDVSGENTTENNPSINNQSDQIYSMQEATIEYLKKMLQQQLDIFNQTSTKMLSMNEKVLAIADRLSTKIPAPTVVPKVVDKDSPLIANLLISLLIIASIGIIALIMFMLYSIKYRHNPNNGPPRNGDKIDSTEIHDIAYESTSTTSPPENKASGIQTSKTTETNGNLDVGFPEIKVVDVVKIESKNDNEKMGPKLTVVQRRPGLKETLEKMNAQSKSILEDKIRTDDVSARYDGTDESNYRALFLELNNIGADLIDSNSTTHSQRVFEVELPKDLQNALQTERLQLDYTTPPRNAKGPFVKVSGIKQSVAAKRNNILKAINNNLKKVIDSLKGVEIGLNTDLQATIGRQKLIFPVVKLNNTSGVHVYVPGVHTPVKQSEIETSIYKHIDEFLNVFPDLFENCFRQAN